MEKIQNILIGKIQMKIYLKHNTLKSIPCNNHRLFFNRDFQTFMEAYWKCFVDKNLIDNQDEKSITNSKHKGRIAK